ncbi:MAG: hypothetical protein EOO04_04970 [Chitinophagaceae bacterium]|nr:MAG: hypothetical protein EOO04_04970 [Chitinophagaceae bacterium]
MKKFRVVIASILTLLFAGCYEVNEEIVINENGSGSYVTKMDMGQLLEMIQTMAGEEQLTKDGLDRAIDTTINMSSLMDSAKEVTADQKELLKNGKLHVQMNVKEKLMKMNVNLPFTSYTNLQKLMSGMGNSGTGIGEAFKAMFDKDGDDGSAADMPAQPKSNQMDQLNGMFDVIAKNGSLSRQVNKEKFNALMAMPEMEQMKQLSGAGMEILYTTTIKLPRPVKKSDNTLVKLSEDKRTVTMKYNLLELLDTPEKFAYTIEY